MQHQQRINRLIKLWQTEKMNEFTISTFFIYIREFLPKGSHLKELSHFIAHRSRTKGRARDTGKDFVGYLNKMIIVSQRLSQRMDRKVIGPVCSFEILLKELVDLLDIYKIKYNHEKLLKSAPKNFLLLFNVIVGAELNLGINTVEKAYFSNIYKRNTEQDISLLLSIKLKERNELLFAAYTIPKPKNRRVRKSFF